MTKDRQTVIAQLTLLLLSIGAFFVFGLHHLTQFVTADEHYWVYERIPQYWQAWHDQKWKKTFINDKPGVTVALVSGVGLLFEPHPEEHQIENKQKLEMYHTNRTDSLYLAFRLPILILNTLFLFYLLWIIGKLTANRWIALWTVIATALSPILVGISQIVNPDALLWTFSTGAFFSYLASLRFPKEKKLTLLTALFLGLAVLSKYTATILYPVFFLFLLIHLFNQLQNSSSKSFAKNLRRHILNYSLLVAGSAAIILLFLPAAIVRPKNLYELMAGFSSLMPWIYETIALTAAFLFLISFIPRIKTFFSASKFLKRFSHIPVLFLSGLSIAVFGLLILGRQIWSKWPLFESIPFDIKESQYFHNYGYEPNFLEHLLLNADPFVFSLAPTIIVLAFVFWTASLRSKDNDRLSVLGWMTTSFLWIFFAANIVAGVVTMIRYTIILYPLVAFLAALGLWQIAQRFKQNIKTFFGLSIFLFACLLISVWASSPFYFNYTNSLLPKDKIITDTWGYGGYEAAQYINAQPNANQLVIWSDYFGVCEFIKGKCITDYKYKPGDYQVDYYVLTRRGRIRYNPDHVQWRSVTTIEPYKYYNRTDPVWQLNIDNRPENSLKIYKVPETGCESNKELCVGVITDIGACQNDPGKYDFLNPLLKEFTSSANERFMSFNISLGDNVNYGLRKCSESGQEDLIWVKNKLNTQSPFHYALGDHDIESEVTSDEFWRKNISQEKTYYSFDRKDVHVIVLDTVLGGDRMRPPCEEDELCTGYRREIASYASLLKNPKDLATYLGENKLSRYEIIKKKTLAQQMLLKEEQTIKNTRAVNRRDRGRVGEEQLAWLKQDLLATKKEKVLIFSDHPLFRFQSTRKLYDIVGRQAVQDILTQSGKQVVAISGEAHLWHETQQNGIHYYIVDQFANNGAWAFFQWNQDGFRLTKMEQNQALK